MAELKTRPTRASVTAFIRSIEDTRRRSEVRKVAAMMRRATGKRARMWGGSIVGYGTYRYSNTAGKNFEWMLTGYSPRKQALTVYIMCGFKPFEALMKKLGKYKTGKSCLYINKLSDVDSGILVQLLETHYRDMAQKYPAGVI